MTSAPRRLDRRPSRSVPATLLALVLLVLGVLGLWTLGSLLFDGAWPAWAASPVDAVSGLRLDSSPMATAAAALVVAGVLLLLSAALPGRTARRLVLTDDVPGATAVSHRDLSRHVRRRVERSDGVQSSRVRVSRRRVDVDALSPLDDPDPVRLRVEEASREAVDALHPIPAPRVRVRMRRAR